MRLNNDTVGLNRNQHIHTYSIFKVNRNNTIVIQQNFEVEPYVAYHVAKKYRYILPQREMGILLLHIETGRCKNLFDREIGIHSTIKNDLNTGVALLINVLLNKNYLSQE